MTTRYFNLRREISIAANRIQRDEWPRLEMAFIVSLVGATGFLTTVTLLHLGISHMWLRYAIAVSLAYGVFLGLLWCWLHIRWFDLGNLQMPGPSSGGGTGGSGFNGGGGDFGGGGATGSFEMDATPVEFASDGGGGLAGSSIPDIDIDVGDAGEAWPLVAIIAVVVGVVLAVGAAIASLWIVWSAPAFLGELAVDAALARGLYKHIRGAYDRYWLKTALRRTFKAFVGLFVLLVAAGVLMQIAVPSATSVGQFFHHFSASVGNGG